MPFEKGKPKTGGREKGTPNKLSQEIKEQMLGCFDLKDFKKWAKKNPNGYFYLISRLMPKDIEAQGLIKLVIMDCLKDNVD